MKKKSVCISAIVLVMISINLVLSTPILNNQSQISLMWLEAKADGDPSEYTPPDDDPIPHRVHVDEGTLSQINDYLF